MCWRVCSGEALGFPVYFSEGSEAEYLAQVESYDSRCQEVTEAEKPVYPTPAFPAVLWGWTSLQLPCRSTSWIGPGAILTRRPAPRTGKAFAQTLCLGSVCRLEACPACLPGDPWLRSHVFLVTERYNWGFSHWT